MLGTERSCGANRLGRECVLARLLGETEPGGQASCTSEWLEAQRRRLTEFPPGFDARCLNASLQTEVLRHALPVAPIQVHKDVCLVPKVTLENTAPQLALPVAGTYTATMTMSSSTHSSSCDHHSSLWGREMQVQGPPLRQRGKATCPAAEQGTDPKS